VDSLLLVEFLAQDPGDNDLSALYVDGLFSTSILQYTQILCARVPWVACAKGSFEGRLVECPASIAGLLRMQQLERRKHLDFRFPRNYAAWSLGKYFHGFVYIIEFNILFVSLAIETTGTLPWVPK
jgi:hypothetical protein